MIVQRAWFLPGTTGRRQAHVRAVPSSHRWGVRTAHLSAQSSLKYYCCCVVLLRRVQLCEYSQWLCCPREQFEENRQHSCCSFSRRNTCGARSTTPEAHR